MPEIYEHRLNVEQDHIDRMGHVNNVVYVRWVQDMAVAHWKAAVSEEQRAEILWVVRRHEIDYKRPALLGDELLLRTWIGDATRRTFERHTEIRRTADSRLLVRAITVWCPVDAETKRLTAVGEDVLRQFEDVSPSG